MKTNVLFTLMAAACVSCVLLFSSFFIKKSSPSISSQAEDEIAYKSNSKSVSRENLMRLSTAFENDYYTNSNRKGSFFIEVKADELINREINNIPLNISLVIDRSGSMSGEKIRNAKKAAQYIVEQLSENDYLSIVIYDGTVDLLQPTTRVMNKQLIKNKIQTITERGGTNLMGGAIKGYEEVKRNFKNGYINRVLLLSDGQANEGITNPAQIDKIVRMQNKENGISISTFGVGADYNEDLMTAMAETGTGNYYFINNAENIASIFQKELNGLKDVVAQQAKIELTIPEFVSIEKIYGYKYDQIGNKITIHLHDVFSNETKGILVKFAVLSSINSSVQFSTRLSFKEVETEKNRAIATNSKTIFTNQIALYNNYFNEWVSAQVALYESNEQLEIAMKEVDKGNYSKAKEMVKDNKQYMAKKSKLVEKSTELQRASTNTDSYEKRIENVESMPAADVKYIQKETKSENYMIRNKK